MPGMKSLVGMNQMGNARELAEMLRMMGRNGDTMLAHITPEEAQMLFNMGGAGTQNPQTGLPEFYDPYSVDPFGGFDEGQVFQPQQDVNFDLNQAVAQQQAGDVFYQAPDMGGMGGAATMDFYTSSRDAEAQAGGFYGGVPSQSELARTRFALEQAAQPAPSPLARGAQAVEDTAAQARALAGKYPTVARLLQSGATSLPALLGAARARRESEQAQSQLRRLGEPLRAQGEALRTQALSGGLTPQQAQQQEAERARLRQATATRGTTTGTQATMIENQLARQRANLSETNLNNAIKMLNLANAYDEEAIRAKIAGDARINRRLESIFSNLGFGSAAQGGAGGGTQQAETTEQQRTPVTRRPDIKQGQA